MIVWVSIFPTNSKEIGTGGLLCSHAMAMAVELDFLLEQYADISDDHRQLMTNFKRKADAVVLANKRLSKLIPKARNLLVNGTFVPKSHLSRLTEIERHIGSKSSDISETGSATLLSINECVVLS